jgi:hypothetical protein
MDLEKFQIKRLKSFQIKNTIFSVSITSKISSMKGDGRFFTYVSYFLSAELVSWDILKLCGCKIPQ